MSRGDDVIAAAELLYAEMQKLFPDEPVQAAVACLYAAATVLRRDPEELRRASVEMLRELLQLPEGRPPLNRTRNRVRAVRHR